MGVGQACATVLSYEATLLSTQQRQHVRKEHNWGENMLKVCVIPCTDMLRCFLTDGTLAADLGDFASHTRHWRCPWAP